MPEDACLPVVTNGGSFELLYRREYPDLVAVARALTGDRNDGEDLVQDTMGRDRHRRRRRGVSIRAACSSARIHDRRPRNVPASKSPNLRCNRRFRDLT